MFKKELASIVNGESIEVIFIDDDLNSLPIAHAFMVLRNEIY